MKILRILFCQSVVIVVLLAALAISNARAMDHKDYTDCVVMGDTFYQLAVFRMQGYPEHLAIQSVKKWKVSAEWQEKHLYMVGRIYAGAHPTFAKAEAIAYCKTGKKPEG